VVRDSTRSHQVASMQVAVDIVVAQKHLDIHVEDGRCQPFFSLPGL